MRQTTRSRFPAGIELFTSVFLSFAVAYMPASITHFISFEVGHLIEAICRFRLLSNPRRWTLIAALRIEAVIYMASEVVSAMKPGASTYKDTTRKPFLPIVAVGSTGT